MEPVRRRPGPWRGAHPREPDAAVDHGSPTPAATDVAHARAILGAQTVSLDPHAPRLAPIVPLVANGGSAGVTVHPITETGDVAPSRTLAGAATGFGSLRGIAVR